MYGRLECVLAYITAITLARDFKFAGAAAQRLQWSPKLKNDCQCIMVGFVMGGHIYARIALPTT